MGGKTVFFLQRLISKFGFGVVSERHRIREGKELTSDRTNDEVSCLVILIFCLESIVHGTQSRTHLALGLREQQKFQEL